MVSEHVYNNGVMDICMYCIIPFLIGLNLQNVWHVIVHIFYRTRADF